MMKKSIQFIKNKGDFKIATGTLVKKSIASVLAVTILALSLMPVFIATATKENKDEPVKITQVETVAVVEKNMTQATRNVNDLPQISRGKLNRDEVYLLAMVIEGEAADEPFNGKVAVGSVILNRMENKGFPKTLSGVIYQGWAFESVMNNQYQRPLTEESIKAAQQALQGSDPTNGALYFWNPVTAKSKWVWSRPVTGKIGRHVFAK